MNLLIIPVLIIYGLASILLLLYGLNCYLMIFFSSKKRKRILDDLVFDGPWPKVTVQLPIFNERNVSERLIEAAAALDYPRDRLEIQVLDDSTDETVEIINKVAVRLKQNGANIIVVHRDNREGYKAGALEHGISISESEFFAVFDADFVPVPDFLKRTIPAFFADERIAFVQTRWGHLNRNESLLTCCQAIGIDGHFLVEQPARAAAGLFMNFNGTAGVWRRKAVEEVGGWSNATLTEDLDLSYRVQLAGWKPYYIEDVVAPAEIPITISALKSQQFRWAKGSIQTARLMLPRVWKGPYSMLKKIEAFLHLTNYMVHPLMLTLAVLAFPILQFNLIKLPPWVFMIAIVPLAAATFGPSTMYTIAAFRNPESGKLSFVWLPLLVLYGTGIAVSNTMAVLEAMIGKSSSFVRTPKKGSFFRSGYRLKKNKLWAFEVQIGVNSIGSIMAGITSGNYGIMPFLIIFAAGFLTVGIRTAFGLTRDA
ncbi:MAG: glycosyltransferase family 2 protein [Candidatus Zixiibacteriota bacterium]|nr:MAG: glycosyltransferase family 2 protein [candidate division Zixibacteria bacterium]